MFTLSIPVSASAVDAIKLSLTEALPDVKSSHRCEAMARGLGFRTHASLLSVSKSPLPVTALADSAAFVRYLAQRDFNVPGSALYRAVAKAALEDVAERYPTLTAGGFGIGEWQRDDTAAGRRKRFEDDRAELVRNDRIDPFLASLAFVSRVERTKTIRPSTNSYWLKHIAENYQCTYPDGEPLGPTYVPNGMLIAAAIHAGFDVKPYTDDYGRESLNAGFNMGKTSLFDLECEIRPSGARAQARIEQARQRSAARRGM